MRGDNIRGRSAPATIARAITQALDDAAALEHSAANRVWGWRTDTVRCGTPGTPAIRTTRAERSGSDSPG